MWNAEKLQRSEVLDIAKGIGILLVVWAHASGPFKNIITQFHMPLFFLISGYLFNSKKTFKEFAYRKIQTLYIPFIFWNILSVSVAYVIGLREHSVIMLMRQIFGILLTTAKDGQFFGATWFLGALFAVSIIYKFLDTGLNEVRLKKIVMTAIFIAVAITGFSINIPYYISRTMVLSMFFAVGVLVREYQAEIKNYDKSILVIFLLILSFVIGKNNSVKMGANSYTYKSLFVIGALSMSYSTIFLSRLISQFCIKIKKVLIYFGKHSIDILIWQFLVFRLVIIVQLAINQLPINSFLNYYPVYSSSNGWWCAYTFVGMFASLLIGRILKFGIWGKGLSKIYVVR